MTGVVEARARTSVRDARDARTVGVEEEVLLVDATTLRPVPVAGEILARIPAALPADAPLLELEAKREQIEIVSPPLRTLDELRATILAGRSAADRAAQQVGARAVALATAPTPVSSHRADSPRYHRMHEQFAMTMREQLTCGLHVHVGIDSPEEGVAVLDRVRPWLPVLLALSANSPLWQGVDTGFASYRYQAWGRWPTSGAYDRFGSVEAYTATVQQLLAAEVCLDPGMIYFDARLSAHVPTVEFRIADVCHDPDDAVALASVCRALVQKSASDWAAGVAADDVPTTLLSLASWRASRFGVEGALVHPVTRALRPAREAVSALLTHVSGHHPSDETEGRTRLLVADILRRGSGAVRQREAHALRGAGEDVIADALPRVLGAANRP